MYHYAHFVFIRWRDYISHDALECEWDESSHKSPFDQSTFPWKWWKVSPQRVGMIIRRKRYDHKVFTKSSVQDCRVSRAWPIISDLIETFIFSFPLTSTLTGSSHVVAIILTWADVLLSFSSVFPRSKWERRVGLAGVGWERGDRSQEQIWEVFRLHLALFVVM